MEQNNFKDVTHMIVDPDRLSDFLSFLDTEKTLEKCQVSNIKSSGPYYIICLEKVSNDARKFIKEHQYNWVKGTEYDKFRK